MDDRPARLGMQRRDDGRDSPNLFFWEPTYAQLTRFLRGQRDRHDLVIVGGTYEGDRFGIERDVRRALRRLGTSYLDVFLLFWTRSPERLSAEALATLRELKQAGLIRAFGFSTHDRELATTALASGNWDVVMTRHSAAHPGAEDRLLPLAREHGVGVLTFSAVCYTRLLRPLPGRRAEAALPTAAECYRYSLSQPGVTACISAPRDHRELRENLAILREPQLELPPERAAALRAHGRLVRDQNRRFDALIRKGHEGNQEAPAPQQLGELLALLMESAPPSAPDADEPLPAFELGGVPHRRDRPRRTTLPDRAAH
ncbi:MAG TPA: aldo/keto reductase [Pseudomonadota bacterium]|nr:aldo/keto reductase [Pseudomonadota bacterium]